MGTEPPGRIEAAYAGRGETYLWPRSGKSDAALEEFCALLVDSGIAASLEPKVELKIWKKLVVNCCLNPLCAITGQRVGGVADVAETWPLLDGVVDEIVAVAQRNGIPLMLAEAHAFLRQVAEEARNPRTVHAHRRAQRPCDRDRMPQWGGATATESRRPAIGHCTP